MDRLLFQLAYREPDLGAPKGLFREPLVIGWGRDDRICPPSQARRALALFPDARLHWFERCGHFPQWDAPEATVRLILESTGSSADEPTTQGEWAPPPPRRGAADPSSTGGEPLRRTG